MKIKIPKRDNRCLIVVGMHRSGTSCLIGNLQQAGLYLGKVAERSKYNIKGNRENKIIVQLNDSLLKYNGGSWQDPPLNISWARNHQKKRDKIIFGLSLGNYRFWGFKDPRALFVLPFWKERLDYIQLVGSFRHPLNVAISLYYRNRIPLGNGLKIWEQYNLRFYKLLEESEFPLISFDAPSEEYLFSIRRVIKNVGLDSNRFNKKHSFYDSSFIHHDSIKENGIIVPKEILRLYDKLNSVYRHQNNKWQLKPKTG